MIATTNSALRRTAIRRAVIATAALLYNSSQLPADPFVNVTILGRISGSSDAFSSTVAVTAGQLIDYQLIVDMAPTGTTNTQGATVRTINSLTFGTDGINSLGFNVFQSATADIQADFGTAGVLNTDPTSLSNDSWAGAGGASGGTPTIRAGTTLRDLNAVRPVHPPGVFTGIDPE